MTRKEWIEKHLPAYVGPNFIGGVIGCPRGYHELVRLDPSVETKTLCRGGRVDDRCEKCWNMKLNIKEEPALQIANCPQIGEVYYAIIPVSIGPNYNLWMIGSFEVNAMHKSSFNMIQVNCHDSDLGQEYTFFYDINERKIVLTAKWKNLQEKYPNLNLFPFKVREEAEKALVRWTGNVFKTNDYILIKEAEE